MQGFICCTAFGGVAGCVICRHWKRQKAFCLPLTWCISSLHPMKGWAKKAHSSPIVLLDSFLIHPALQFLGTPTSLSSTWTIPSVLPASCLASKTSGLGGPTHLLGKFLHRKIMQWGHDSVLNIHAGRLLHWCHWGSATWVQGSSCVQLSKGSGPYGGESHTTGRRW